MLGNLPKYATLDHKNQNSRPRNWRNALEYIIREFFRREIAVFEQGAGFNFNVTNRAKLFNECAEGMQGADRLDDYYQQ